MDDNTNVSQVRPGDGASRPVRALTRIVATEWSPQRLEWLWKMIQTQDYAFDDLAKGDAQAFLDPVFNDMNEWYEIGDDGIAMINWIDPKCTAFDHFAV